ncbi:MAG TPA: TatD family hydrolase [Stackebrandtia sp.]|uniref:TatD family hydrolase n=1 Tax=Stackebrandtia sp. TaxID=2023065 RepID=UPI002D511932|nr:TatD family hydrolase [Stackebrandtia sp.]HZE40592.1 TatD family hydrolase [Stackebrandtia sp.]
MSKRSNYEDRPAAPEPLPVPVPDNHTHLDFVAGWNPGTGAYTATDPASAAVTSELDAAAAVGVDRVVQVGTDVASSRWAVELAESDDRVRAAVALHPNEAPKLDDLDAQLAEIDKLAQHPLVVALGETGMDSFRTGPEGTRAQEHSLRQHIALAKTHRRALMIHDRESHDDVLRVLDDEGAPDTVVMHCFSGDAAFAAECARRGYHMSFAGNVSFKNAPGLREAAAACPPDLMLVETDAPFMAPVPHRGRRNGPYLMPTTVRFLAAHLERDLEAFCSVIAANTRRVYGSW